MFSNYRSYCNKEPEQHCMTDHHIKNNHLSSFENKQRSFSNISYMVFFTYFTIMIQGHYNRFISSYPLINGFCQDSWNIDIDRDKRECKDRQLWVEIGIRPGLRDYSSICPGLRDYSSICPGVRDYSSICPGLRDYSSICPGVRDYCSICPGVKDYSAIFKHVCCCKLLKYKRNYFSIASKVENDDKKQH